MRATILIADDDPDILLALENRINWMGHDTLTAHNGKDALRLIQQEEPDLVILDIQLPFLSGLEILQHLHDTLAQKTPTGSHPGPLKPSIIALTAFGTIELAVKAMQLGAIDFLAKPFSGDYLTVIINKALDNLMLQRQLTVLQNEMATQFGSIVGQNPRFQAQLDLAKHAATSTATVLILGETGTGKDIVARAIHNWSPRSSKPFVAVNCAAIPKDLLENELFGHEKGSFTGAVKREAGKIEVADGGTVFLDEIGDMSMSMQSHLLRVLQDQTFYRVGGTHPVHADVRFVAATNKDLKAAIREGQFREDLYYRLEVISLRLPPLRERMEDIPALAEYTLRRAGKFGVQKSCTISNSAMRMLMGYQWPGNIRELENVLTRACILSPGGVIEPEHLHLSTLHDAPVTDGVPAASSHFYHEMMECYSRKVLEDALKRNGWNQTKAAEELGLQRTYFTKLLRQKQIAGRPPKMATMSPPDMPEDHPT